MSNWVIDKWQSWDAMQKLCFFCIILGGIVCIWCVSEPTALGSASVYPLDLILVGFVPAAVLYVIGLFAISESNYRNLYAVGYPIAAMSCLAYAFLIDFHYTNVPMGILIRPSFGALTAFGVIMIRLRMYKEERTIMNPKYAKQKEVIDFRGEKTKEYEDEDDDF
jgi:hypothetical protein